MACWLRSADGLQIPAKLAASAYSELESAYGEPHRHYHTLSHIEAVLLATDLHRDSFDDAQAAELALAAGAVRNSV